MTRKSEISNGRAIGIAMLLGSIGMIAFCLACLVLLVRCAKPTEEINQAQLRDTIIDYVIDTIPYYEVVPKDSVVVRYVSSQLKIKNSQLTTQSQREDCAKTGEDLDSNVCDSVEVVLPITQKYYEDSTFSVWVSGYKPSLDSIYVFPRKEVRTITIHTKEQKRWSIGVSGGIGVVYDGGWHCGPGVSVGVSYSF